MQLIVCPGVHSPELTQDFLSNLRRQSGQSLVGRSHPLVVPVERYPPYSSLHILWFLHTQLSSENPDNFLSIPLVFVGFSAGVIGAIGAAWGWQVLGGKVRALIALDGWGVPLIASFPVHRLSHDYFTHWSSALLGPGEESFYADPPVEHLDMWRSPHLAVGWQMAPLSSKPPSRTTAADFVTALLKRYGEDKGRAG